MDFSTLKNHLAECQARFKPSNVNPTWDESEEKAWAVQEYLGSKGCLTDEDRQFLKDTDPELLALEDDFLEETDDGDEEDEEDGEGEPPMRCVLKEENGRFLAVFPDVPWTSKPGSMTCYSPTEGHGECVKEYVDELPDLPEDKRAEAVEALKECGYSRLEIC